MKVLVDTSMWSLALRKKKDWNAEESAFIVKLSELIEESAVEMIGPIRQEVLSGISSPRAFSLLKEKLEAWKDIKIESEDYIRAAEMFNICRKHGIQGSHVDFLICAIAERHQFAIFTLDNDFILYAKHLPIWIYV